MEKIKCDLSRFKKKEAKACQYKWQQVAKDCIEDFGVIHPYDKVIWRHAKKNLAFLEAQITNLKEHADWKGDDLKTYGRLLTWKLKKHANSDT